MNSRRTDILFYTLVMTAMLLLFLVSAYSHLIYPLHVFVLIAFFVLLNVSWFIFSYIRRRRIDPGYKPIDSLFGMLMATGLALCGLYAVFNGTMQRDIWTITGTVGWLIVGWVLYNYVRRKLAVPGSAFRNKILIPALAGVFVALAVGNTVTATRYYYTYESYDGVVRTMNIGEAEYNRFRKIGSESEDTRYGDSYRQSRKDWIDKVETFNYPLGLSYGALTCFILVTIGTGYFRNLGKQSGDPQNGTNDPGSK